MNRVPLLLGRPVLPLTLAAIGLAACASGSPGPTWTFGAPAPAAAVAIDGYVLGPQRVLTGDEFHRLEATARAAWASKHPHLQLSGIEVREAGGPSQPASGAAGAGSEEYLVVVTVARGKRHVVTVRCDRSTFPAMGSCS